MVEQRFKFVKTSNFSVFHMLVGLDWNGIKAIVGAWKDGTRGYAIFKKEGSPKSRQQLGYYYAVILPHAVQAFKDNQDFSLLIDFKGKQIELELTLDNMDTFLKTAYAKLTGVYMDKSEMDMADCSAYEDWCIKWVAKWLDYQIPPADREYKD